MAIRHGQKEIIKKGDPKAAFSDLMSVTEITQNQALGHRQAVVFSLSSTS